MKKKIALLSLCVALLAVAIVGGTLAYFTDTDSDVNVMVTGRVDIEQHEKDDEGNPFVDPADPIMPAPSDEYDSANHIDKVVTVTNEGTVDAYVRTLYAFEDTWDIYGFMHVLWNSEVATDPAPDYCHYPSNGEDYLQFKATVNGVETIYTVGYLTYQDALLPTTTSPAGMMEIWLDAEATNEWSEYAGTNYEILVLSQGAQTAGFNSAEEALNTAFGEITYDSDATVAEWFKAVLEAKYPDATVTVEAFDYSDYYTEGFTLNGKGAPSWFVYPNP